MRLRIFTRGTKRLLDECVDISSRVEDPDGGSTRVYIHVYITSAVDESKALGLGNKFTPGLNTGLMIYGEASENVMMYEL